MDKCVLMDIVFSVPDENGDTKRYHRKYWLTPTQMVDLAEVISEMARQDYQLTSPDGGDA